MDTLNRDTGKEIVKTTNGAENLFFLNADTVERERASEHFFRLGWSVRQGVTMASIKTEMYGHKGTKCATIKRKSPSSPFRRSSYKDAEVEGG